jgi:hypothetical protein
LRGTAVGIVVTTFIAAGALGATAIRNKVEDASANRLARANDSARAAEKSAQPAPNAGAQTKSAAAGVLPPAPVPTPTKTPAPSVASAGSPAPRTSGQPEARTSASLRPVIPVGQSSLPDSVTAVRGDSDVVVSFDLMMVRTRRAAKFEQLVRSTLPLIYGRPASDALSKIADGGLASQGELLDELPKKGLRIPGAGWTIRLFPETRPGQDGPLVVRYRVSVTPSSN